MPDINSPVTTRSHAIVDTKEQPLLPVYYLTLIYHPVLERIGERAELGNDEEHLSRQHPLFFHPHDIRGKSGGRPLEVDYISRTPIRIVKDCEDTIIIYAEKKHELRVNGHECNTMQLTVSSLDAGVVIDVHDCVVLLLHRSLPLLPVDNDFGMLGFSHATEVLRRDIQKVSDLEVPVLIRGESGTGKELVAQALHSSSPRTAKSFVAVNIAAIPESLSSALLFGAEKGAYTGAARVHKGHFMEADGGSIFLDEVGDCPDSIQLALLRVLETKTIQPLGSASPRELNVRIISATDARLETKIKTGEFRLALFQRLATVELTVPPLRERKADIGFLLTTFLQEIFVTLGEAGQWHHKLHSHSVTAQIYSRFCRYSWPGNIRQLKNYAMQMAVASRSETQLCLPELLQRNLPEAPREAPLTPKERPRQRARPRDIEQQALEQALCEQNWDIQAAARVLNISRASLYSLIDKHPKLRRARDVSNAEIIEAFRRYKGCMAILIDELRISMPSLRRRLREIGDKSLLVPAEALTNGRAPNKEMRAKESKKTTSQ